MFFPTRLFLPYKLPLSLWFCVVLVVSACTPTQEKTQLTPESTNPTTSSSSGFEDALFGDLFSVDTSSEEVPAEVKEAEEPLEPIVPNRRSSEKPWNLFSWATSLFQQSTKLEATDWEEPATGDSTLDHQKKALHFLQAKLSSIQTIYVQSFTGENLDNVRKGLFEAIESQGKYQLEEILPDKTENMAVLRIHIQDYSIWDKEETFPHQNLGDYTEESKALIPERIIRRNALVGVQLSLFDAKTGIPLVRGQYSQPFQQIYAGKAIDQMPKQSREMERLTKILIIKILRAFSSSSNEFFAEMELERGTSWGWFAEHIHDRGNSRIVKGIKLAKVGQFDEAVNLWKLVLFTPEKGEPAEIYRINRASAYSNLGLIYQMQDDHLFAAKMFSQANRLQQTLKYAQAWGDNMHTWIDQQNQHVRSASLDFSLPDEKKSVAPVKKTPDVIFLLETNPNLLLNAQQLWPLEPVIKNATPEELNGTQRSALDKPRHRFDQEGYISPESNPKQSSPLPRRVLKPNPAMDSPQTDNNSFIRPLQ